MHNIIIIDAPSTPTEHHTNSVTQEMTLSNTKEKTKGTINIFKKTANFLHRYSDQPNGFRIFISKN